MWTSEYFGKQVECFKGYTPESVKGKAEVVASVQLPVSRVTCAAIGGPNMDWMIITCGIDENEPDSGKLFIARVETKGVPESRFKDSN